MILDLFQLLSEQDINCYFQTHLNECFLLSTEALSILSLVPVRDNLIEKILIKSSSLPGRPCSVSLLLHDDGDLGSGGVRALI